MTLSTASDLHPSEQAWPLLCFTRKQPKFQLTLFFTSLTSVNESGMRESLHSGKRIQSGDPKRKMECFFPIGPKSRRELQLTKFIGDSTIRERTSKWNDNGRNAEERRRFNESKTGRIKLETKTFNGMRMEEAD